jgi:hypothetical protein
MGGDTEGGRASALDDARFGKPSAGADGSAYSDNQRTSIIEIICEQSWEEAVQEWLKTQNKFYSDGMRTLVNCWIRRTEKQGSKR